jgi:hypothetical protein
VRRHRYRLVVAGGLGEPARQAFEDFEIGRDGENTTLTADLDQAALYGALNRINSLGLELVEVVRLGSTPTG